MDGLGFSHAVGGSVASTGSGPSEPEDDRGEGGGLADPDEDVHQLASRIASMRAEIAELERAGRGLADAHARADREIKMRQALEVQRATTEAEAARLRDELKALEAAKLQESLRCMENAEIANQWKERSDAFERELLKERPCVVCSAGDRAGGGVAGGSGSGSGSGSAGQVELATLRNCLRSLHNVVCSYSEVGAALCESVLVDHVPAAKGEVAANPFALTESSLQLPRFCRPAPAGDTGEDWDMSFREAIAWDPSERHGPLIAALLDAKSKLAAKLAAKAAAPASAKPPSATDADENSIDTLKQALTERNALLRRWEEFASHWEERGREAERLNEDWEKSFDALQDQYTRLALEHAELIRGKSKAKADDAESLHDDAASQPDTLSGSDT